MQYACLYVRLCTLVYVFTPCARMRVLANMYMYACCTRAYAPLFLCVLSYGWLVTHGSSARPRSRRHALVNGINDARQAAQADRGLISSGACSRPASRSRHYNGERVAGERVLGGWEGWRVNWVVRVCQYRHALLRSILRPYGRNFNAKGLCIMLLSNGASMSRF